MQQFLETSNTGLTHKATSGKMKKDWPGQRELLTLPITIVLTVSLMRLAIMLLFTKD